MNLESRDHSFVLDINNVHKLSTGLAFHLVGEEVPFGLGDAHNIIGSRITLVVHACIQLRAKHLLLKTIYDWS